MHRNMCGHEFSEPSAPGRRTEVDERGLGPDGGGHGGGVGGVHEGHVGAEAAQRAIEHGAGGAVAGLVADGVPAGGEEGEQDDADRAHAGAGRDAVPAALQQRDRLLQLSDRRVVYPAAMRARAAET